MTWGNVWMKNVSIIIPVYKDWLTLQNCIESLKENIDGSTRVILINDMSSEWEILEEKIQDSIKGYSNFEYYKNTENLGFVKTCNRAVKELDHTDNDILLLNSDTCVTAGFLHEMREVLYLCEKHGVVCPRSNNATLLTIPVKNNLGELLSPEISYGAYKRIRKYLPRFSIIPTGVGFAFLIKRDLIDKFGLFDEVYSPGYNEENDFCMRINQYGYNVVMANNAYVFHYESKSFEDRKNELEILHRKTLLERYPYYDGIVQFYFNHTINPIDYYGDLIAENIYPKKRILFSLYEIPSAYNGTAKYGLSIFKHFYKEYRDKYDISVLINREADEYHHLSDEFDHVFYPDTVNGHTFHLAFAPSQIFHMEHLLILNRVALKYVFCMQDIISIRSNYLLSDDSERYDIFRKSIEYCDGMTSISQFSLDDTIGFYKEPFEERQIPTKVIYHGIDNTSVNYSEEELPFKDYFMVFGNFYKHKFLAETIEAIRNTEHQFVILGTKETGYLADNIYGYKSGDIPDELINSMVGKAKAILFPSVYEGFGLPILDGIKFDKKVIATNNELNRELKCAFDNFGDNILLFDDFKDMKEKLDRVSDDSKVYFKNNKKEIRDWDCVSTELEGFLNNIMNEPIDKNLLIRRWNDLRYLENVHRMYARGNNYDHSTILQKMIRFMQRRTPGIYWMLRNLKDRLTGLLQKDGL